MPPGFVVCDEIVGAACADMSAVQAELSQIRQIRSKKLNLS
jgi:hypothetical protein